MNNPMLYLFTFFGVVSFMFYIIIMSKCKKPKQEKPVYKWDNKFTIYGNLNSFYNSENQNTILYISNNMMFRYLFHAIREVKDAHEKRMDHLQGMMNNQKNKE